MGDLELLLTCEPRGPTRPARALAQPPIQISRVRYDDPSDPQRAIMTLLTLGGVLTGDRNILHVELGECARATLVMAAATQILSMPSGHAEITTQITLAANSRLTWLAEPTILFRDSELHQRTQITLAPGAQLAFTEILTPGRLARGEIHQFRRYQNTLEVQDQHGRLLVAEHYQLEPTRWALDRPGLFADQPVVGSLFLLGNTLDTEQIAARLAATEQPNCGVTTLPNQAGILIRILGQAASAVRTRLHKILAST